MSSSVDQAVKKFIKTIRNDGADKRYSYNRTAKVVRKEGDTAWVSFDGITETPARLDVSAGLGDKVTVRVADGRAWVIGNNTEAEVGGSMLKDSSKFKLKLVDGKLKLLIDGVVVSTVELFGEEEEEIEYSLNRNAEETPNILELLKGDEVISEVELYEEGDEIEY